MSIKIAIALCMISGVFSLNDDIFLFNKHHNNAELKLVLDGVHANCPSITKVYKLSYNGNSKTVNNSELLVIEFSKSPGKHVPGIPEFKYIGNMHGNEVVGREMLLRFVFELCKMFNAKDPFAVQLIEKTRIHVMPSMNPDGWNLANLQSGNKEWILGRANGNNIDLNRNFPDLNKVAFHNDKYGGPIDHLMNDIYWTKSDLQMETKMVMKWILENNFVLSANLHGGDVVANYPYDESRQKGENVYTAAPDDATFRSLALAYAKHNPNMYHRSVPCEGEHLFPDGITNGADWYSVDGGMQDFNYLASNTFEITVEMGCTKFPSADRLDNYWKLNGPALLNYALQVHTGIKGSVLSNEQDAVNARIIVYNVSDPSSPSLINHHITTGENGDYYRLLANGDYVIIAEARGYQPLVRCIQVINQPKRTFSAQILNFELVSLGDSRKLAKEVNEDAECNKFPGYSDVVDILNERLDTINAYNTN